MNKVFKVALAAILFTATGGVASAATTSFNFALGCGDGVKCDSSYGSKANVLSLPGSFTLTDGDLDLEVSAHHFRETVKFPGNVISSANVRGSRIGRFDGGAGVFSNFYDNHTIDGNQKNNDFIQLKFSQDVELSALNFGFVTPGSNFRFLYDLNGDGEIGVGDFISNENPVVSPFDEFAGISSRVWGVVAFGNSDSFKLRSVAGTFEVAAVPLPAAGLLLLAGLGGLGAMSRRKRKAA